MKFSRTAISVAVALAMVMSISLGIGARAIAAPAKATVTINLAGFASTPTEPANLKLVLKNFAKKYPSIKVNYQVINGDFKTAMVTRLTANTAPDVFYVQEDYSLEFEKGGQLLALNSFAAKDKAFDAKDFYKGLLAGFTYKGKVYGYPKDYSTLGMWYNKDLFSAAGISKPPTTWAALQSDACKLTDKAKNVYGAVISGDMARWLAFEQAAGGPPLLNKSLTKASVDTPQARTALSFYAGLVTKGCAQDPASVGAGWNGEAFGKGRAAIVFEGNWLRAPMQTDYPTIHWGLAPLPKGPKSNGNLAFSVAYSIWKHTKHPNESWKLLSYLTGKQGMKQWVDLGGFLPARKSIKAPAGTQVFVQAAKYSRPFAFPAGFSKGLDAMSKLLLSAMKGQVSVTDALKQMQQQANAALNGAP